MILGLWSVKGNLTMHLSDPYGQANHQKDLFFFFYFKSFKGHLRGQPDFVLDEQCKVPAHYIAPPWAASKGLPYALASFQEFLMLCTM